MRRLAASLLALCFALPIRAEQGEAAHFFVYRMAPGATAKFEDGYRRHLEWHRRHHDPLARFAWSIEDGERSGYFVDASLGEPFAAFDHRVAEAEDGADFRVTAAPFATPVGRPTYVLLRGPSTGTPLEAHTPTATMQVTYFQVRPGTEASFERALDAAHRVLAALSGAPAHTWYRLVSGGSGPQYLLFVARDGWAGYDRFNRSLPDLLAHDAAALRDYAAAVRSTTTETWRYRPELSVLP